MATQSLQNNLNISKLSLLQASYRIKPITESQKSLNLVLERRRVAYQAAQRNGIPRQASGGDCDCSTPNSSANTTLLDLADDGGGDLSSLEKLPLKEKKKHTKSGLRLTLQKSPYKSKSNGDLRLRVVQPKSALQTASRHFIDIDSKELAERVVSRTKLRLQLKRSRKNCDASKSHPPQNLKTSKTVQSDNVPLASEKHFYDEHKPFGHKVKKLNSPLAKCDDSLPVCSTPQPLTCIRDDQENNNSKQMTTTIPSCPSIKYLKIALKVRNTENKKKVKREVEEKEKLLMIEEELRSQRRTLMKLKTQQRAEIYALNRIMAEYENQKSSV